LRDAFAKDYRDISRLRDDADLDALRSRDDFKKLQEEMERRPAGEK
jgi:hypothetical protein